MNGAASDVLPRGYRNEDIMFDINLYSKKTSFKSNEVHESDTALSVPMTQRGVENFEKLSQ